MNTFTCIFPLLLVISSFPGYSTIQSFDSKPNFTACRGKLSKTQLPESSLIDITPYMLRKVKSLDECLQMCYDRLMFCYTVIFEKPKKSFDGSAFCRFAYWQRANCNHIPDRNETKSTIQAGITYAYSCLRCEEDADALQTLPSSTLTTTPTFTTKKSELTSNLPSSTSTEPSEIDKTTEIPNKLKTDCAQNFTFFYQPAPMTYRMITYGSVSDVADFYDCAVHCHQSVFCHSALYNPQTKLCRLSYKKLPCIKRPIPAEHQGSIIVSCMGCK
ncbi:hypothetical protein T11_13877 [Trichinella zimbabwensis]|uniref:Apple domain-containing protein n=2 Tax=Trichinella TaxID=6333 RepID=A0A0V1MJU5_9BILA|nr:hypothetical protein T11_13877 [Trichinella zimbabwensis]KRZ71760.1 hypothetical protein T10_653 [Trichinella papuae]